MTKKEKDLVAGLTSIRVWIDDVTIKDPDGAPYNRGSEEMLETLSNAIDYIRTASRDRRAK